MKILYLSFTKLDNSVNAVYINGLRQNGVNVEAYYFEKRGFFRFLNFFIKIRKNYRNYNFVIIGYESPKLVLYTKMLMSKKIIFNTLCSTYERMIISRNLASKISLKSLYYWFIDFIAVRLSNLVMLESKNQIDFFSRFFRINRNKLFKAWTGVDDTRFVAQINLTKNKEFTVLFRGSLMPESGYEYVVEAANILKDKPIKFLFLAGGIGYQDLVSRLNELKLPQVELNSSYLPIDDLVQKMQSCHLSLGQLSNHPRLIRTIPHKAYESLLLGLPYLTAENPAIMELLTKDLNCITCKPADSVSLAEKILWCFENPEKAEMIGREGKKLFLNNLSSQKLALVLLERMNNI